MSDIGTMPMRELIAEMREQVKKLPSVDMINGLFITALLNRMEEQQNLLDKTVTTEYHDNLMQQWQNKVVDLEKKSRQCCPDCGFLISYGEN